jgi:predicted dehydrogenase
MNPTRRFFVGAASAAAAFRVMGANDRVPIGVIGLGGRGRDHLNNYLRLPDAQVVAVCDVDQASQERAVAQVERANAGKPAAFGDMRKLLESKDVAAVSIATPNHWHALATLWSCRAGKDVYVEKPASWSIYESALMVRVARETRRMVQVGSQSRSIPHKMKAVRLLHEGIIGDIYMARALCYKRRKSIGRKPNMPQPPPGVDWDLFLGPAPMRPFNELRFKYNWHWFWDTGNGDIGNQGVHEMDIARWGMKVGAPLSVVSTGGKLVYDDDQETPNTQLATMEYAGGKQLVFEVRGLPSPPDAPLMKRGANTIGNIFYGSEGVLAMDGDGFRVFKGEDLKPEMEEKREGGSEETALHMKNFLDGCRSRNYKDLHAEIEIGALSATLCHMANISYRVGRRLQWDDSKQAFRNDAEANRLMTRPARKPYAVA